MSFDIARFTEHRAAVAESMAEARAFVTELRMNLTIMDREIAHVQKAGIPREEVPARVQQLVAERGAKWLAANQYGLRVFPHKPHKALLQYGRDGAPIATPEGLSLDFFGAVCAGLPTLASELLTGLAAAVEGDAGPASDDRQRLVEKLRRERDQLAQYEEQVVDELIGAGLDVSHRPEVQQRREAEARRRELEERDVAQRRQRQAALDADDDQPKTTVITLPPAGGPTPSAYLAPGD